MPEELKPCPFDESRLTGRDEQGNLLLLGNYVYGNNQDIYNAISVLEEYEDTGFEPDEIYRHDAPENNLLTCDGCKVYAALQRYHRLQKQCSDCKGCIRIATDRYQKVSK